MMKFEDLRFEAPSHLKTRHTTNANSAASISSSNSHRSQRPLHTILNNNNRHKKTKTMNGHGIVEKEKKTQKT